MTDIPTDRAAAPVPEHDRDQQEVSQEEHRKRNDRAWGYILDNAHKVNTPELLQNAARIARFGEDRS